MKTNTAVRSKAGVKQAGFKQTGFKQAGVRVERVRRGGTMQLRLIPGGSDQPDWVLDERTRKVGRQGVAQAREILRSVAPPDAVRQAS